MMETKERKYLLVLRIVTLLLILSVGMNTLWAASWIKKQNEQIKTGRADAVEAIPQSEEEKMAYDDYYEKKLKGLLSDEELNVLAQQQWNYRLSVNGKKVSSNIIYIEGTPNVRIVLAEVCEVEEILPQAILNKGSLWKSEENASLYDYMTIYTNELYEQTCEESDGNTKCIYNFKDLPKGTVITLHLNDLLRLKIDDKEKLKSNRVQIIIK